MAATATNGVVLRTPYAIINNFRRSRPGTLSIKGADYRDGFNALRGKGLVPSIDPAGFSAGPNSQRFVYVGDTISFDLQAPANSTGAAAFDVVAVNQSSGSTAKQAEVGFNAVWQKSVNITITAIHATTGAVTYTTAWS